MCVWNVINLGPLCPDGFGGSRGVGSSPIIRGPDISRPSPYAQDNDPLHALSILNNHLLVSGDVLRRLVFFIFVV